MTYTHEDLLARLSHHQIINACFSDYVIWVCTNVPFNEHAQYDLINILVEGRIDRLDRIEEVLAQSIQVLGLQQDDFVKAFGFTNDLLTSDPEKIFDILSEPLVVNNLNDVGFSDITKVRRPIRIDGNDIPTADFIASFKGSKFAIEVKTVRMEQNIQPGQFMGDPLKSFWWGEMLRNNVTTKIEDKHRRLIDQLSNTVSHFNCDKNMLVVYTRRLGPSTLLSETEVIVVLGNIAKAYPQIDHFCIKLFSNEIFFYPKLNDQ